MLANACKTLKWTQAPEHYPWHQLGYQDLQIVRSSLLAQGYAISSINMALSGLRSIAKAAFNLESMDAEKLMRIQAVQPVKGSVLRKGRCLSKTDIKAVLKTFSQHPNPIKALRDKALFLVGCTAGLRCAELTALTVDCFDAVKGTIQVLHAKGRKQREIYLCPATIKAITQWLQHLKPAEGALFRHVNKAGHISHHPLSGNSLSSVLQQLQRDSNILPFTPHDLRRTFISQLLSNGEDINTVRQLAGHTSITTTVIYDYRGDSTLKKASQSIRF
ncbi:MAG: site-specific integrase [Pseudomonadales bacterium]